MIQMRQNCALRENHHPRAARKIAKQDVFPRFQLNNEGCCAPVMIGAQRAASLWRGS
jgi:hypothetical protein